MVDTSVPTLRLDAHPGFRRGRLFVGMTLPEKCQVLPLFYV